MKINLANLFTDNSSNKVAVMEANKNTGSETEGKDSNNKETEKVDKSKLNKDRIILNVRGVHFDVLVRTLDNVPNGRINIIKHVIESNANINPKTVDLDKLDEVCDDYSPDLKVFYFNRNPVIFENILKFYQQPVLEKKTHINLQDICPLEQEEEFKYWNIDWEEHLHECCAVKLDEMRDKLHDEIRLVHKIVESVTKKVDFGTKYYPHIRQKVWYIMEKPKVILAIDLFYNSKTKIKELFFKSSILARVYMTFTTLVRLLAILNTILSSIPSLNDFYKSNDLGNTFNVLDILLITWFTFGKLNQFLLYFNPYIKLIKWIIYFIYFKSLLYDLHFALITSSTGLSRSTYLSS
jgi:hypothetical protein